EGCRRLRGAAARGRHLGHLASSGGEVASSSSIDELTQTNGAKPALRDLIYFDLDKASSLFSQLHGGLVKEVQEGRERSRDRRDTSIIDFKLLRQELQELASERMSQLETRVLHHDLLVRLEEALFGLGVAVDI